MELTLCGYKVVVIEHPSHKLREASFCGRCEKMARSQNLITETCFTKNGARRHQTV